MVAQVAEHSSEKAGVGSANLPHGTPSPKLQVCKTPLKIKGKSVIKRACPPKLASVGGSNSAAECFLAKEDVAGANPVSRSIHFFSTFKEQNMNSMTDNEWLEIHFGYLRWRRDQFQKGNAAPPLEMIVPLSANPEETLNSIAKELKVDEAKFQEYYYTKNRFLSP